MLLKTDALYINIFFIGECLAVIFFFYEQGPVLFLIDAKPSLNGILMSLNL